MKHYIAELGLLLVGIFWGLGFVFVKIGLNEGINPLYLLMIRFIGTFIILFLIYRNKVIKIKKRELKGGIALGIIQFLAYIFQTYGAELTSAGKNAFFTAINVVLVPYIFWILHKKRPQNLAFVASLICLIGVGIMSFDNNFNLTNINLGDVLTIVSAIFFASHIVLTGYFTEKIEASKLMVMQMFIAGVLFTFSLFFTDAKNEIKILEGMALISVVYLLVFSTTIPIFLQTYCQKYTISTKASLLLSTESLFAPLFAYFMLGEILSVRTVIGALLILVAVLVSELKIK